MFVTAVLLTYFEMMILARQNDLPWLRTQIGNPDGKDKPNKKYYDPRACIRSAEESTVKRMEQCFEDLRCVNVLGLGPPDSWRQVGLERSDFWWSPARIGSHSFFWV